MDQSVMKSSVALALLLALPAGASAQEASSGMEAGSRVLIEARGGVNVPQGDIAFSKAEELGTSDAWVWPFTAGIRAAF